MIIKINIKIIIIIKIILKIIMIIKKILIKTRINIIFLSLSKII